MAGDVKVTASMTRQDVLSLVKLQLGDILEIDPSSIGESDSFADDLNADSLALIELVEALEQEMSVAIPGFHIDDDELENLRTVRDAVDYVAGRLEKQ
ncbi:MAG: acyl carrier protein [Firmicutes bacterium]|jgi:acyl carrier protein|nr:acyl carrier protein [Bacillota bacterium]